MSSIFITLIYLGIIIGIIFFVVMFYRAEKRTREHSKIAAQKYVLLRILVPRENEKTPLAAEQMFAALHGIYRPDALVQEKLSFEISSKNKYIQFYSHVPAYLKEFVEGQIYAQYPDAEISSVDDYAYTESSNLKIVGTELKLNREDVYPIKTFLNFEVDPLAGITGVLSHMENSESVWVQIMIRPTSDAWQNRGVALVNDIKSGSSSRSGFLSIVFGGIIRLVSDIIGQITTGPPKEIKSENVEGEISGPEQTALKGVEQKITKLGFETKIRIVAISDTVSSARAKLESAVGVFKQYNTTNLNGFSTGKINVGEDVLKDFKRRSFLTGGYVFNIEEIASIFHLPNKSVETPSIVWTKSKKGEPPFDLPIKGNVPGEGLTIFAKTNFRHLIHKFGIKLRDRRYHFYAIGKTGTGKSTMLENMIYDDIIEGRGVAVVDPHGDLIKNILNFIPNKRVNDIVLFNPADREHPVAFNVLENVDPDLKSVVASGVVGIFKKIFGESWGPRLEYILRNTLLALLDFPDATLLGVTKILVDKRFREKVVNNIKDPVVRDFFISEFERYDERFRTEAIAPIQNKVGQFLSSSLIRNIVGQAKSTINIEEIMNEGKILLLDLSIGKIGEDSSSLLGAMMITKIQLAAMSRASIPEAERSDFYLFVDEFQNFATEAFATILSEARKYHLNIVMTNQYIAQMPEEVADAVFGNVGTLISFRVGAPDADALVKEFEPVFDANDLVNLDNYNIYIKMSIDGVTCPAFSAVTLSPCSNKTANEEKVIKVSRERYGRNREFVEKVIAQVSEFGEEKSDEQLEKEKESRKIDEEIRKERRKRELTLGGHEYKEIQARGGASWFFGGGIKEEVTEEKEGAEKKSKEETEEPKKENQKQKEENIKTKSMKKKGEIRQRNKQTGKEPTELKRLEEGKTVKV